jgi:hypothetical protein
MKHNKDKKQEEKAKARWLKDLKKIQHATENFWTEVYPQKSWEEKLEYWQNNLEKAILEQEKQNLDTFAVFDHNWYQSVLEQEAEIEKIIKELFAGPWAEKDETAFWEAVKTHKD